MNIGPVQTIILSIPVLLAIALYFLPTIIAVKKGHMSTTAIFLLNLLLGWTFLGWVVTLVWSFSSPTHVIVNNIASPSAADEIQKLASLRKQGLLTDDEFNIKKRQILGSA